MKILLAIKQNLYQRWYAMTCSIQIIRRKKPRHEVKYIDDELEVNIESALLDLYEKVGILKERIERLENERRR